MQIDVRIMELLASKLCHDLVSPVSAINNGVELIEDVGGSVIDDAMKLIRDSGNKAARRLRVYRLAYGRAGSDVQLAVRDVRQVAEQYLTGSKIKLVWPEDLLSNNLEDCQGFLKTLLNLILLAEETLAYGGTISLHAISGLKGDKTGCRIEIAGRNAALSLNLQEALEGSASVDDISPRSVQAYVTGRFAEHFCLKLGHDHSIPDTLNLLLSLPNDEPCIQDVKVS